MLFLSIAWCPKLLKLQIKAKKSTDVYDQLNQDDFLDSEEADLVDWQKIRVKTARQRMTAITSFTKLLLTPAVAALCAHIFYKKDFLDNLDQGFKQFSSCTQMKNMFITQIVCTFLVPIFGRLACIMGLQKACFALPILLSFPVSLALTLTPACERLKICLLPHQSPNLTLLVAAVLLWLAQICSTFIYIWQPQQFLMAKEEILFWLPSYDGKELNNFTFITLDSSNYLWICNFLARYV